jgi:hypothetical protein
MAQPNVPVCMNSSLVCRQFPKVILFEFDLPLFLFLPLLLPLPNDLIKVMKRRWGQFLDSVQRV